METGINTIEKQALTGGSMLPARIFEVTLYNQQVRESCKNNQDHPLYNCRWADPQKALIRAQDCDALQDILDEQYPLPNGFVILEVRDFG